jgi:hypothetical protein
LNRDGIALLSVAVSGSRFGVQGQPDTTRPPAVCELHAGTLEGCGQLPYGLRRHGATLLLEIHHGGETDPGGFREARLCPIEKGASGPALSSVHHLSTFSVDDPRGRHYPYQQKMVTESEIP